jgi:hypothetical protein
MKEKGLEQEKNRRKGQKRSGENDIKGKRKEQENKEDKAMFLTDVLVHGKYEE